MDQKRKTFPSVLLVILSTLGFLIGLAVISNIFVNKTVLFNKLAKPLSDIEKYSVYTIGFLALTICTINIFTLVISIRYLCKKNQKPLGDVKPSVLITVLVLWFVSLGIGYLASHEQSQYLLLAFVTTISIWLPIWILVTIARSGISRSTRQRELIALTLGLTLSPAIIIILESVFLYLLAILLFISLGFQNPISQQILQLVNDLSSTNGGIEIFDLLLFDLNSNPILALTFILLFGMMVPLIEEVFKPLAIWFLLKNNLRDSEGYALGLISGGAFAILESAGLAIQMNPSAWLSTIVLRAATGVLHIGLSGIVGFGLVRSKNKKQRMGSLLFILTAAGLHGLWNFLSLYSGFTTLQAVKDPISNELNIGAIVSVILMVLLFFSVVFFNVLINRFIRKNTLEKFITKTI